LSKKDALQLLGPRLQLPTLPEVVVRLNALVDDPRSGLQEIGALVARDPALTAKVLRIANSAFYGLGEPVLSAEQAASVIGVRSLRNVVLQASILARYERFADIPDFDLDELWTHSAAVAKLSRALSQRARSTGGLHPDDAYTCGLLHDVGKVVLLESLGEEYIEVLRDARASGLPLHVGEAHRLGVTHIEVGALLATRWQLPATIVSAIEFHHGPSDRLREHREAAIVAIADQIAYRAGTSTFEQAGQQLGLLAERLLGVPRERFAEVLALALEPSGFEEGV